MCVPDIIKSYLDYLKPFFLDLSLKDVSILLFNTLKGYIFPVKIP